MNADFSKSRILICDDSVSNLLLVSKLLESENYSDITAVSSPENVLEEIAKSKFDLLLLDIEMPIMDGFEVMKQLHERKLIDENFPIIIITGRKDELTRNKALSMGAIDFINKPFDQIEILLRVRNTLRQYAAYQLKEHLAEELEKQVEQRTIELEAAQKLLVQRLSMAGELKDEATGKHVIRVGKYSQLLAELIDLPPVVCDMIGKAAPLHDVGKIAIPDSILLKNGQLDEAQWVVMRTHAEIGAKLLYESHSHLAKMASSIALSHHEKWDGSGYPSGLAGETIPVEGRITALCDVFDALLSKRPYKEAWTLQSAVGEIQSLSGSQFDPSLTNLFVAHINDFMEIYEQHKG